MPLPGPLGASPLAISALLQIQAGNPQAITATPVPEPKPRPGDSVAGYFPTIVDDPFLGLTIQATGLPTVTTEQVLQGQIGNCPVTAVLAALAHTKAAAVTAMITRVAGAVRYTPVFPGPPPPPAFSHFFKVTFPGTAPIAVSPLVYRVPRPVQSTDPAEVMYAHSPLQVPSWVSLIEKAYVLKKDRNPDPLQKNYSVLDGGGKGLDPIEVMNDIAGTGAEWVIDPAGVPPDERGPHPWTVAGLTQVFNRARQIPVVAASRTNQSDIGMLSVFAHHDYAVIGMLANGKVQLYNCHPKIGQDVHHFKDPSLTIPEFQKAFVMVVLKP
jgi:hypothetical protein